MDYWEESKFVNDGGVLFSMNDIGNVNYIGDKLGVDAVSSEQSLVKFKRTPGGGETCC